VNVSGGFSDVVVTMQHARRTSAVVDTAANRASSAAANELTPGVNGGKHLICLRDLTSK